MADSGQIEILGERHGLPFYRSNPSIPPRGEMTTRRRTTQIAKGGKAVVVNADNQVLGKASIAFMQTQEVDSSQFVKLYMKGLREIAGLTKAGISVCELVYLQMQEKANNDQIILSVHAAREHGIGERTYRRGLRDLLEKEVLFASPAEGLFFLNIQYMFNGDKLHFVTSYHRAIASKAGREALGFEGGES